MKLQWPIDNVKLSPAIGLPQYPVYISQVFGVHPEMYARFGLKGHDGLDIAAPLGTPVKAAHDGFIIESVAKDTGYGLRVQIYNPEGQFTTIYGHFERSNFPDIIFDWNNRSYPVKAGDIIGFVDSTGFSTGNHLHLGLRFYNNYKILNYDNGFFGYVDPLLYLKGEQMQLIKDNGVVYLVSGINQKVKTGIADMVVEAGIFGDEPIVDGDTSSILETHTISSKGFIINDK